MPDENDGVDAHEADVRVVTRREADRREAELPAEVAGAAEAARGFAERAKAENTKRAYRADWRDFRSWCAEHGRDALPASPETVTLYIADRASPSETVDPSAAEGVDAGAAAGRDQPGAPDERAPLPRLDARGAAPLGVGRARAHARAGEGEGGPGAHGRRRGDGRGAARRWSGPTGRWSPRRSARRDRALLLLGFAGALRRSELAALTVRRPRLRGRRAARAAAAVEGGPGGRGGRARDPLWGAAALVSGAGGAGVGSICCNNGRPPLPSRRPPRQRRRHGARAGVRGAHREAGRELGPGSTPPPTPGTRSGRGSPRRRRRRGRTSGRSCGTPGTRASASSGSTSARGSSSTRTPRAISGCREGG